MLLRTAKKKRKNKERHCCTIKQREKEQTHTFISTIYPARLEVGYTDDKGVLLFFLGIHQR